MTGNLPEDWTILTIDQIKAQSGTAIAIGPFGSRMKAEVYVSYGIPVIRGTNISDTKVFKGDFVYISAEFAKGLKSSNVYDGDLVFPHRGSIGEVGIITGGKEAHYILSSSLMKLTPNRKLADPLFIFYYFRSDIGKHELLKNASQVGTPGIQTPLTSLKSLDVYIPPLPEQRAIAGILGALDDKIELNRRMNCTLESMARAVFREMMKGVEEQGSILEFANLLSGGTPKTAEESYWNGNIEWVSAKDVSNANGLFLLDTEKKITQEGVDNSATKLLPAKTVIVTARGTVGANCMLGKPMTMNQTNYGLKAKDGIGDYFVYFTLSEMVEQLKQQSYGTIFDTITTKTFQSALCTQPSIDVIHKFEGQVTPLMDAILNNQKESRTLASLRDSLLPKLMRGEVRVKA